MPNEEKENTHTNVIDQAGNGLVETPLIPLQRRHAGSHDFIHKEKVGGDDSTETQIQRTRVNRQERNPLSTTVNFSIQLQLQIKWNWLPLHKFLLPGIKLVWSMTDLLLRNTSIKYTSSILRVSDQNGVSLLYIIVEIHHCGWTPSM